ncbi:MAG: PIG-L deacetylase family protein [Gaiella sp.]
MLDLAIGRPNLRVLAIGAHSDDIEIGCGATMLDLARALPGAHVTWVVLSGGRERAEEARASAEAYLTGVASDIRLTAFRDAFFPHDPGVKEYFETLKEVEPDLVLCHARHDLHQDHRVVSELVGNTFRDHLVLEYEIPKYDGDLGAPNVLVPVSEDAARRKAALLIEHFASQRSKYWFTEELFLGLMRVRGVEARSETGFAEGFHGRKLRVDFGVAP